MIDDIGVDCYFYKGKNDHIACQDYALVGRTKTEKWAVLADGCSSSPDTDIGARLVAWGAKDVIESFPDFTIEDYYITTILNAHNSAKQIKTHPDALDATLLTLRVGDDGWIRGSLYGDGFLVVKYSDGWLRGVQVTYPGGYPKYLNYSINKERSKARDERGGPGFVEAVSIAPDGTTTLDNRQQIENHYDYVCPTPEGAEAIFIASDGLCQFGNVAEKSCKPFQAPLRGLTGIKGYAGQFVRRRAIRFLGKECSEMNVTPFDDVSIAGVRLKEVQHG